MDVKFGKNNITVSSVKCLNLDLTLDCGQAFRWDKQNDGSWSAVADNKYLNIKQDGDCFTLTGATKSDFEDFWKYYFDFDKDYEAICNKLKEDRLLSSTIDNYYGIRILNQEPWEALCSFVISQQNNIKRIKKIINNMCAQYGGEVADGFYSFPSAQRLAQLSEGDFIKLGLGYRAKYIEQLAKGVAGGTIDLDDIKHMSLDDARKALLNIYGVGVKVANCALLYGFGFYSACPIDVWMKRVMEYYPNGLPECFKGYEGIAQQYLFHWARNNLK